MTISKEQSDTKLDRLCILSPFPPPAGGMAVQAVELVKGLTKAGLYVIPVRANITFRGFLNNRWVRAFPRLIILCCRVACALRQSKILYILSASSASFFLTTMPAIAIAWLLRKCVIVNYHGGEARIFLERWGRIVKYVLARVDMVIVPSGFLKRVFLEHEVHCEIVPNVVDLSDFSYKLRRVFKPVFLVPRHLKPEYNVGCAIRAFRIIQDKLPEAELYITGTGSEERYLKHLAEDPRLRRVNFLGHVPHSEMPSLYRHCDMVLNTSNLDNLPCFILEAFASGVPVISTRAGGIPYVITDSQTGFLVDLNDHEGIASVALYLMENPDLARDITENARQAVEQYTWKTVESKLLGIYSRTLKSREICY